MATARKTPSRKTESKSKSDKVNASKPTSPRKAGAVQAADEKKVDAGPSDALIRDFTWRAIRKKREHGEAHDVARGILGEYRTIVKSAKKAGIDTKAMLRVIEDREREHEDVVREERNYLRIANLFKMPMTQGNLFDAPKKANGKGNGHAEADEKQSLDDADDNGYRAGIAAREIDECPFHQVEQNELWERWTSAWHRGQAHNASGLRQASQAGKRGTGNPEDRLH